MRPWRAIAMFALAAIGAAATPADACTCVILDNKACATFWEYDTVFTGVVRSVQTEEYTETIGQRVFSSRRRVVTFADAEVARGDAAQSMTVRTAMDSAACGYDFNVGRRYIVYGYRDREGALTATMCSPTRPIERAADDLAFIRSLAAPVRPGALALITGDVKRRENDGGKGPAQREEQFAGPIPMTLTGRNGTFTVESRDGAYETRIPPGRYDVAVQSPPGFYAEVWPKELFLGDPRACATVNVAVSADGRISGQVVDTRGAPVAGIGVMAAVVDPVRGVQPWSSSRATTDDDGRFVIARVGTGDYEVVVSVPGASIKERSATPIRGSRVSMTPSETRDIGEIRLPTDVSLNAIRGTVVDERGDPVAGAGVSLASSPRDGDEMFDPATTDDQGRFTLAALTGRRYVVTAHSYTNRRGEDGSRINVNYSAKSESPVSSGDEVRLTLKRTAR